MAKQKRQRAKAPLAAAKLGVQASSPSERLTFNPFARLADITGVVPQAPESDSGINPQATIVQPRDPAERALAAGTVATVAGFPRRLTLRTESKGRHGKVVTRIIGLEPERARQLGVQMQKALGCGSVVEGDDLVLLGAVETRAAAWLRDAGAKQVTAASEARAPSHHDHSPAAVQHRHAVRPGQRVAVVLKEDQRDGTLTEGVVESLLTRSPTHPHGIKVRLESGLVGRVKRILGP